MRRQSRQRDLRRRPTTQVRPTAAAAALAAAPTPAATSAPAAHGTSGHGFGCSAARPATMGVVSACRRRLAAALSPTTTPPAGLRRRPPSLSHRCDAALGGPLRSPLRAAARRRTAPARRPRPRTHSLRHRQPQPPTPATMETLPPRHVVAACAAGCGRRGGCLCRR